jgi:hypothetical protein
MFMSLYDTIAKEENRPQSTDLRSLHEASVRPQMLGCVSAARLVPLVTFHTACTFWSNARLGNWHLQEDDGVNIA